MELDDKLVEFLMGIEQRLGKAEDWVASEIPAYVSEILTYHTVVAVFWLVMFLGLFSASVYLCRDAVSVSGKLGNRTDEIRAKINEGQVSKDEMDILTDQLEEAKRKHMISFIVILLSFAVAILAGWAVVYQGLDLVKIQLAPRVYVVDYIRSEIGKENDRSDSNW